MLSFDTNILVYAADRTAGERHAASIALLNAAVTNDAVLNEQSVIEFLHVATRKQKQPVIDAANMVQAWLKNFPVIMSAETAIEDTIALLTAHSLSVWDAHMLAICAAHGCETLLSEDLSDGALYGSVRVLNPFNPRNALTLAELLGS